MNFRILSIIFSFIVGLLSVAHAQKAFLSPGDIVVLGDGSQYKILSHVSQGGYNATYLASPLPLQKVNVALKVSLKPNTELARKILSDPHGLVGKDVPGLIQVQKVATLQQHLTSDQLGLPPSQRLYKNILNTHAVVIMEYAPYTLEQEIFEFLHKPLSAKLEYFDRLTQEMFELINKLQKSNLYHVDIKKNNIVRKNGELTFIDLDSLSRLNQPFPITEVHSDSIPPELKYSSLSTNGTNIAMPLFQLGRMLNHIQSMLFETLFDLLPQQMLTINQLLSNSPLERLKPYKKYMKHDLHSSCRNLLSI